MGSSTGAAPVARNAVTASESFNSSFIVEMSLSISQVDMMWAKLLSQSGNDRRFPFSTLLPEPGHVGEDRQLFAMVLADDGCWLWLREHASRRSMNTPLPSLPAPPRASDPSRKAEVSRARLLSTAMCCGLRTRTRQPVEWQSPRSSVRSRLRVWMRSSSEKRATSVLGLASLNAVPRYFRSWK
jgi:hypothetical protein